MSDRGAEFCPSPESVLHVHDWTFPANPLPIQRLDDVLIQHCRCGASQVTLADGLAPFLIELERQCAQLWADGFYAAWDIRDARERRGGGSAGAVAWSGQETISAPAAAADRQVPDSGRSPGKFFENWDRPLMDAIAEYQVAMWLMVLESVDRPNQEHVSISDFADRDGFITLHLDPVIRHIDWQRTPFAVRPTSIIAGEPYKA